MKSRTFTRRLYLLMSVAVPVVMLGCNRGPSSTDAKTGTASGASDAVQRSRGTIGYSALTLENPFFKVIGDSLTAEAAKNGFEVIINDAAGDVHTQSQHIDNFITQKVTAIVINPADRKAIAPAIRKANEAGVPLFTCDLQCEEPNVKIAGHVGSDNFQGGELAGRAMIEALGPTGGKVLILHYKQANSCVLRVEGFRKVIEQHNAKEDSGKVEIVEELEGGGSQSKGFRAASDALQAHPDLNGIFAINDPSALGAWTALKQAGKTDQVVIVGFDGQLEGKQAIKAGKIYADPVQFPKLMGSRTVEKIVKYLDGEEYEEVELIPTELYRKADADKDPELR